VDNQRRRIVLSAMSCTMVIAGGCARKLPPPVKPVVNPLVGKWSMNGPDGEKSPGTALDIHADGTMTQTQPIEGKVLTLYSRYTTAKGILIETLLRAEAGGKTIDGAGQSQSFEYAVQGDTLMMTTEKSNAVLMFTRVKP